MEFRIADTFTDSLAKLTGEEQKAVKTAAFDLQIEPGAPEPATPQARKSEGSELLVHPGWSRHAANRSPNRDQPAALLCQPSRRSVSVGGAPADGDPPKDGRGAVGGDSGTGRGDSQVRGSGTASSAQAASLQVHLRWSVPRLWGTTGVAGCCGEATEDSLLEIAGHLPAEAAEALLNLATGIKPPLPEPVPVGTNPFEHPDALRRFSVMKNVEELALALEYPWERWAVFLHPAQRQLVQKDFNGPARVAGSAGTGKTIVALHRAFHLARINPDARVLLTTFSDPLAKALDAKRRLLLTGEPRLGERIEVHSMDAIGRRLYELNIGKPQIASRERLSGTLEGGCQRSGWEQVLAAIPDDRVGTSRGCLATGYMGRLP